MTAAIIPMPVADPLKMAWLDTSDLGNARRLVIIAGGRLLWLEDLQAFVHYDGQRWALERGGIAAQRLAQSVVAHIDDEARAIDAIADDAKALKERIGDYMTPDIAAKRVEVLRAHAVRSGSAGMTSGMLKQARSFIAATLDDFDQDPLVYNVANGTLRFACDAEGRWSIAKTPHDPNDRLMQLAAVEYDPKADCPFWVERLAMLTPDPEQLAALQPLYGYTLTGLTSDQAFYVHQGKGGDGKSVTHMALSGLHGDYYRHAGVRTFLQSTGQRGGSEHRSDLVRLKGDIRFVTCDEPPPRSVWDGETIKQITGSMITARGANERTETTYRPRFKLFAECNITPRAPSDDKGFRRRFKMYQWTVSLDDTEAGAMPVDAVLSRLEAEKSGILNWLIAGALQWLETRVIPQPSAMTELLRDFWSSSSPLMDWMSEWCDTSDPHAVTPAKALWDHFKQWKEDNGIETGPANPTAFGNALRDKQFAGSKDGRGIRQRKGIKLRAQALFGDVGAAPPPAAAAGPSPPQAVVSGQPAVDDDPIEGFDELDKP